jgi:hypothetical protein
MPRQPTRGGDPDGRDLSTDVPRPARRDASLHGWWVRFRQHGKTLRQSAETTSDAKARAFLREREGKVALEILVNVTADRLTLGAAADLIRHDYTANGHKSAGSLEYRLTHLLAISARRPGWRA